MKLIFSLTLTWVLYRTATALRCITCADQSCLEAAPKNCSSETMCITGIGILGTLFGRPSPLIYKACASASLCPATGSRTFSINLGSQRAIGSAECCRIDDCNSHNLPSPPTLSHNTLQCYACDSNSSECNTIRCSGDESTCFKATATNGDTTTPILGCATSNMCSVNSSLSLMKIFDSVIRGPTCCATNLCNDPRTTTTTTTTHTPTTATGDASSFRLGLFHLLLGIFIFII